MKPWLMDKTPLKRSTYKRDMCKLIIGKIQTQREENQMQQGAEFIIYWIILLI